MVGRVVVVVVYNEIIQNMQVKKCKKYKKHEKCRKYKKCKNGYLVNYKWPCWLFQELETSKTHLISITACKQLPAELSQY